jgi:hypothetical protein
MITSFSVLRADDTFDKAAGSFFRKHCFDCHGPDAQEGDIAFHEIKGVTADNAELWKRVWEQVALKQMPPRDYDNQPESLERVRLANWITAQLARAMKDKGGFTSHLHPSKGNHLDHDLLFGEIPDGLEPPSSPARIWRVHPQEHLTRLSNLINKDPEYDPAKPGLRTRGDLIGPNLEGEIKVYYGLDRVIGWVGGTAAYAASITGFPPPLSTTNDHGLRSYPTMYSVNGAEATQIAGTAENIIRFMAYGPDAEPYQFADKVSDIPEKYKHGDLRGLAQSLFYAKEAKRPMTPVFDLFNEEGVSESKKRAAVEFLFESLTCRPPTDDELAEYLGILNESIDDLGKKEGAILGLSAIFLDPDALFRTELATGGMPDEFGRVMLQDQELALAINAAFSYLAPDDKLKQAVVEDRLKTREDVAREVARILADDSIRKPRMLQFFREYFDYDRAGLICKDSKALTQAGANGKSYLRTMVATAASTDRLIELIVAEDKQVLRELLTTNRAVVQGADADYFGEFVGKQPEDPKPPEDPNDKKKKNRETTSKLIRKAQLPKGEPIYVRIARVVQPNNPRRTLTTLPEDQRKGILTHPAWLVSHSDAMDNHAIHRGKWIRERLLGGAVPDVPITVDAMLPDEPNETLRHRMRVTQEEYCWKCHQKMDPLGLPFEMFNHIGLYRTQEMEKPVDTSGEIIGSGDTALDGKVSNALEMIDRLAHSERVDQVFVRHVFRFWMGRNETINDAPVLQDAWQAYRDNDGSMKAMLASLLTSDAFLYRKVEQSR